jgi:polysaccharide biosynthesis transport protein
MDEFELKDYLFILRRRKKYFIAVASVILLLSVVYAYRWSNYRSTATVEVAPSEISAGTTIPSGMNASEYNESLADSRISHIQQQVLSIGSLIEVITKFDLYPDTRKVAPVAAIAEGMFRKIKLELVNSSLAGAGGQKASGGPSAITFTLSFDYNNPLICQQVTNELVTRFLDEDLKERRKAAHETSIFLEGQIKALEASMVEQEKKIAEFRAANKDVQPESLTFNMQAAQSMMFNIQSIDAQITGNEGTQGTLRGQLATVDPYSRVVANGEMLTTPSIQLKALKAQYATLSAQYGPEHPDVIKIRHQIAALEKQVGSHTKSTAGELQAKISDTRTNLAAAKKTYGADHPDVKALQTQLAKLESQLAAADKNPLAMDDIRQDADNPSYLQIVAELKAAEEQYNSLMKQKDMLIAQQAKYQSAVAANPLAEQKLATLSRDYVNSQLRYRELKEKKMAADMSETIEQDRNGQRMIIVNPPELPLGTQPRRLLFVVGGLLLAVTAGLVSVAGAQIISQSVIGARHLESLIGVAPLVTVPHMLTEAESQSPHTYLRDVFARIGLSKHSAPLQHALQIRLSPWLHRIGPLWLKRIGIVILALIIASIVFSSVGTSHG